MTRHFISPIFILVFLLSWPNFSSSLQAQDQVQVQDQNDELELTDMAPSFKRSNAFFTKSVQYFNQTMDPENQCLIADEINDENGEREAEPLLEDHTDHVVYDECFQEEFQTTASRYVYAKKSDIEKERLTYHMDCQKVAGGNNGKDFKFCVYKDDLSTSDDIIYMFHGATGNPETWGQYQGPLEIREEYRRRGLPIPTVVAYSIGPVAHFLNPKHIDHFFNEHVPYIEKFLGWNKSEENQRIAIGFSMGGFNTIQLSLHQPEFFSKIMVSAPALPLSRHSWNQKQFKAYMQQTKQQRPNQTPKTGGSYPFMKGLQLLAPDDKLMDLHHPLIVGKAKLESNPQSKNYPKSLVIGNEDDMYGFGVGAKEWVKILKTARGGELRNRSAFHFYNGGHCAVIPAKVVDFLSSKEKTFKK